MYYEEKVINGVLHYRGSPNEDFIPMSAERLTELVFELRNRLPIVDEPQHDETPWIMTFINGQAIPK